jgi:hypothetical protein
MNFYQDGQQFALRQLHLEKFAFEPSSLLNRTGPGGTFPGAPRAENAYRPVAPPALKPATAPIAAKGPGQPAQNPRQTQPAVGQMAQKPTTMPGASVPKIPTAPQAAAPATKPMATGPRPTTVMPAAPRASEFPSAMSGADLGVPAATPPSK